jgi:hypothetical protein
MVSNPHRLWVLLLILSAVGTLQGGCSRHAVSPPTPSNPSVLTKTELARLVTAADKGDLRAMNTLANYYFFYAQDNAQAWTWVERAGDAGDVAARKELIHRYEHNGTPDSKKQGELLRKKWGISPDNTDEGATMIKQRSP